MSIYAALSNWAYRHKQSLEAEQAVLEYLSWLQSIDCTVATREEWVRVPRGTRELFLEHSPQYTVALQRFHDFLTGASKGRHRRTAKTIERERGRLISIIRAMEQKQRWRLIGMLYWRHQQLDLLDTEMRKIWGAN
jgi:hypothetical protein